MERIAAIHLTIVGGSESAAHRSYQHLLVEANGGRLWSPLAVHWPCVHRPSHAPAPPPPHLLYVSQLRLRPPSSALISVSARAVAKAKVGFGSLGSASSLGCGGGDARP